MSFEYSGDPKTDPIDALRFLIGDTAAPWAFSDQELDWLLSESGNVYLAAADTIERAQGTKSGGVLTSKRVGGLSETYSQAVAWYSNQAKIYRSKGQGARAVPTYTEECQIFSFRQFDNPKAGNPRVSERCSGDPSLNKAMQRQEDES